MSQLNDHQYILNKPCPPHRQEDTIHRTTVCTIQMTHLLISLIICFHCKQCDSIDVCNRWNERFIHRQAAAKSIREGRSYVIPQAHPFIYLDVKYD